jgi:hypothetical protein
MTFQPGKPKTGGRQRGARNKLGAAFLNDLLEEWQEGGREALRIARLEDPVRFSAMVASLLPKEMTLEIGPLQELPDDRLIEYIEYAERQLERRAHSIESREESQGDGEQALVLQTVQSPEEIS